MGAGKTNILPFYLNALTKRTIVIMQPNRKLAEQTFRDLSAALNVYHSISGEKREAAIGKFIYG